MLFWMGTCNAVNPTWSSGQDRNEGETDKFKKFERSHLPSSENLPKNVYGLDGERLGQIRFLVLLFLLHSLTHTHSTRSPFNPLPTPHTRQSKLFFRLFNSIPHDSRLPFDFRASCGSVSCCSFALTHSQAKAPNCVSTVGQQDEERFSRLQGFAWNFLMVVEAKNGRRNIWFREGWDFYVFGYRFHLHAEPMGTKSVSFNSYFSIFCAMHRWINFSGRYKRTGDVQRVPKKSAGEIGFLCSPLISHKLELFRSLDKTARRAICLIRVREDW